MSTEGTAEPTAWRKASRSNTANGNCVEVGVIDQAANGGRADEDSAKL